MKKRNQLCGMLGLVICAFHAPLKAELLVTLGLDAGYTYIEDAYNVSASHSGLEERRGGRLLIHRSVADEANDSFTPSAGIFVQVMTSKSWGLRLGYAQTLAQKGIRMEHLQFSDGSRASVDGQIEKSFSFVSLSAVRDWKISERLTFNLAFGVGRAETTVETEKPKPLNLQITNNAVRNQALSDLSRTDDFGNSVRYAPILGLGASLHSSEALSYGVSLLVSEFENGVGGFISGGVRVGF